MTRPWRFALIAALVVLVLILVAFALYVTMIVLLCNDSGGCYT